ncbi:phage/plasmid replication protein, II/X family [Burkholderia aenigmatica]|uniref:phage/plasmid replication protein, II/X family n=1 Tax=Burkholderia aenigmatica TaxID=2015348 RepID=UPI001F02D78B|nr:phage/plasmid replication protein, II/X family [Burkholderia aenigmatica]UKD10988.1 phage/plasmid replication protein, II/X family [Burkholderia aenigmatica]
MHRRQIGQWPAIFDTSQSTLVFSNPSFLPLFSLHFPHFSASDNNRDRKMIDLLDVLVYIEHAPFGNKRIKESPDSVQLGIDRYSNNVQVHDGGAPLKVMSMYDGKAIAIRCSPLKALQGHNVFGTNNVCAIASAIICCTLDQLKITYSREQAQAWATGHFEIRAIDITHRLKLPDGITVLDLCDHLRRTVPHQFRPQWLDSGIGVRLSPPSETGTQWVLYDKHQELLDKRKHARAHLDAVVGLEAQSVWSELLKIAHSTVRAELKLSHQYLKRHGLTDGHQWTARFAQSLYFAALNELPVDAPIPISKASALIRDKRQRLTFALWTADHNPRDFVAPSTFRAHRRTILDLTRIDIAKHVPITFAFPLSRILCRDNLHNLTPDRKSNAAFVPVSQPTRAR